METYTVDRGRHETISGIVEHEQNKAKICESFPVIEESENSNVSVGDQHCNELSEEHDSDVLSQFIGHYGKWQFTWTLLLSIFQLPTTFHIFAFVFQSAEKEFWCSRPDHLKTLNISIWRNVTQPNGPCSIRNYNFDDAENGNLQDFYSFNHSMQLTKCKQFEYSNETVGATIGSEWNLVCDRKHLLSIVEMSFLAGAAAGSVCSGWISDKFGRRHTLMAFASIQTAVGTLLAFSNSLIMYATLRIVIGFASMAVTVVSFVLVVELVSGKWRTIMGILNILPVAISYTLAAGIAYLTREWRVTQLVISAPWILLLLIWFCLPESPRWLLARERYDELKKVLTRAVKFNNKMDLPSNYDKIIEAAPKEEEHAISVFVLFHKEYRRNTLLNLVVWFTLLLFYFGLTLHLSNLGGDIYANAAIAGSVEATSICFSIFVVMKMGTRMNLIVYNITAGVCCILVNFIPENNLWAVILLAMIAKCTIGANNAIIPTFTARLYPTVLRNLGVGIGNFAAGFAMISVPYLWLLEEVKQFLPMTIMGIGGIIGAIALMFMKVDKHPHKQKPASGSFSSKLDIQSNVKLSM